jgi:Ca2+-binding RTX toxin-like protein
LATINGTSGADTLIGDDTNQYGVGGDDTIHGGDGNDVIDGRGGPNSLYGDAGDDTIIVSSLPDGINGSTNSVIDGGSGFDTLDLSRIPTSLGIAFSTDGTFLVDLSPLRGGSVSHITVSGIESIILGSNINDVLLPGVTTGLKIVSGSDFADINTGSGTDTIVGGSGDDFVHYNGGNDADTLAGGRNRYLVETLSGNADHVTVSAGSGYDIFHVSQFVLTGDTNINLATGTASIGATTFSLSGFDEVTVDGSHFNTTITGDDHANLLGVSWYLVSSGGANLDGGGGDDTLQGGQGADHLLGGNGDDTISGGDGDDQVDGGNGIDHISGNEGNNHIDGGAGDDWIEGGGYNYLRMPYPYQVDSGSDVIAGGSGNDHIWGSREDGAQTSLDGADTIDAGDGSDYVNGNAGADVIHGGAGTDRLYGGADDDKLYGEAGSDHLNGNKGNDTLDGGDGNDELFGGQGSDQLAGSIGNDSLSGDVGADTLRGGAGIDTLTGGADADVFAFAGHDAAFSGPAFDLITDFLEGTDKIMLPFLPVSLLTGSGSLASAATVAQQLLDGHAGDHEVAAVQVGGDAYLFYASDAGGIVDSAIRLAGVSATAFQLSDFV